MRVAKQRRLKRKARLARRAARDETRQEREDIRREEWGAFVRELEAMSHLPDPHDPGY